MPQIFRIGSYVIYIWSDEGLPIELVHVHIPEGRPTANATKVWISKSLRCIAANNKSQIPSHVLYDILELIELRAIYICQQWKEHFSSISFFC